MSVWVVCADSTRARIFRTDSPLGTLTEVQDLVHPESRIRPRDLVSDRPGRTVDPGRAGRHTMGNEDVASKEEADRFARALAETLNKAAHAGKFERLHLMAAPAFLGLVRKHLDRTAQARVSSEVAANVATQSVTSIRERLPQRL